MSTTKLRKRFGKHCKGVAGLNPWFRLANVSFDAAEVNTR